MKKPPLSLAGDMAGENHIGYLRGDAPVFHTIVRAPGGAAFTLGDHFETCPICKQHGVTLEDFHSFMAGQSTGSGVSWFWCCPECGEPLVMATVDKDSGVANPLDREEQAIVERLCSSNHPNAGGVCLRPFIGSHAQGWRSEDPAQ